MKYDSSTNEYIYTRVNGTEYKMKDPFPSITATYWGQNTPWNLEHKITWDEISPSLQELILVCRYIEWEDLGPILQARVLLDEQTIRDNTKKINDEITDRKAVDAAIQANLSSLTNKVNNIIIPKLTELEGDISRLENTINGFNSKIVNLQTEDNKLWTAINNIWGSNLYMNNHETYDIYRIWQHISSIEEALDEFLKVWGDEATRSDHRNKNIKKIWEKLAELEALFNNTVVTDDDLLKIWGDKATQDDHNNKNIKKIWEKLDELTAIVNSLINLLLNKDDKIIDIKTYSWDHPYGGHTYHLFGVRIQLRDISETGSKFIIWGIDNMGRDSDNNWGWPMEGIYFRLPESWPNGPLAMVASDKAYLDNNGCRAMGCSPGKGSEYRTHVGVKVNIDYDGGPDDEEDNTISWSAIAIGY